MKCNIGKNDKNIRLVIALVLLVTGHLTEIYVLNALGLVLIITGYYSFCGMYKIFNIDTTKK